MQALLSFTPPRSMPTVVPSEQEVHTPLMEPRTLPLTPIFSKIGLTPRLNTNCCDYQTRRMGFLVRISWKRR